MPDHDDIVRDIKRSLGALQSTFITSDSKTHDLFEVYVFTLILKAARAEGAQVSYEDVDGNIPSQFEFRTSPGHIYSRIRPYTHAIIEFDNTPALEAHVGIKVAGRSKVFHECDVAVIKRTEGIACRRSPNAVPRHKSLVLAVECKFYASRINLHLARAFLGLSKDISTESYFVVNTDGTKSVGKLLAHHRSHWQHQIVPSSSTDVVRLTNVLQNTFKDYVANNTL